MTKNNLEIESLESSVEHVIKICQRRQKFESVFGLNKKNQNQTKLANFMDSMPVHVLVLFLLVVDLVITIVELTSSLKRSCGPDKNGFKEEEWYHWLGIAILSLLSLKSVALAVGMGGSFFRQPGCVVDGVVVVVALFLEVFLKGRGGGLLVVVSLWRVVRVIESAFELSNEAIQEQIDEILSQMQILKENDKEVAKGS